MLSISRKSGIYATKITTTSVSFVRTSISFRPLRTQERREEIFSYQFLNLKNQIYLYLPTYPLNSFRFFHFLLQPRFCLCNMPFLIFYPPSRDKTHVCFHSPSRDKTHVCFQSPSRDKTHVCFHSFLENVMRSLRKTRYHYQKLIEHQYPFQFESIPLASSFLY